MIRSAGIGAAGLWSISRGLARGLEDRGEYKRWMDAADGPPRGDRDGCGNLSQTVLNRFTQWFLAVMLDQIRFTRAMFDLEHLAPRYDALIRDTTANDTRARRLIDHLLRHGEMARGDAALVARASERTARDALKGLLDRGFVTADGPKMPVRVAFPIDYRERLFPNLFSEAPIDVPAPPPLRPL